MDAALEIQNLCFTFPDGTGVQDISLRVKHGDIYALFGGHHAGKTVLLQTIIGTIRPQSGVLKLFGNEEYEQEKRRIGYVPQTPLSIGRMTIADTFRYFSLSYGVLEGNIEKALALNLNEKKPVCRLPLSIQRLVNLGIALLGGPDLVFMDAPFAGLDAEESDHLLSILSFLNEERRITFFLTGQDYASFSRIATRYGVLANGKLLAELTPAELEERCKRCIKIRTAQLPRAIPVLAPHFSDYEILTDDLIRVFCPLSCSAQINTMLTLAGVEVSEIWVAGMEPQEYLSKLAGGEAID